MTKPIISLVCAMANNRVIGKDNDMPWHMPADLKHFKSVTMGKPIVMGRKTYESIGRPLPGRRNIIITRNLDYKADGIEVVSSVDAALNLLSDHDEIMITGGGNIYQQTIDIADKLHLTFIDLETDGDAFFPQYDHLKLVEESRETHLPDDKNPHPYQFVCYKVSR
ncbi:MAG: type 3 dihydrofolate reductase [Kangiellaceae bacterium]|jgi:dihydrofolate reductase|nr:type 3 dihydrofolate reductase [Kangiellaceae bacterium]